MLNQRRTPDLCIQCCDQLLPDCLRLLWQQARSLVERAFRFLRQALPAPVVFVVGGVLLQLPPASERLHDCVRITSEPMLIDLFRSLIVAPIAFYSSGETLALLLELRTTQLAHQCEDRLNLRLA